MNFLLQKAYFQLFILNKPTVHLPKCNLPWVSSTGSFKFLGLKKVLCRRLRGLGLEEGHHWHYLDAEDFSPNGGAVFW